MKNKKNVNILNNKEVSRKVFKNILIEMLDDDGSNETLYRRELDFINLVSAIREWTLLTIYDLENLPILINLINCESLEKRNECQIPSLLSISEILLKPIGVKYKLYDYPKEQMGCELEWYNKELLESSIEQYNFISTRTINNLKILSYTD